MDRLILLVSLFVVAATAASQAAPLSPLNYWHTVLHDTPMPTAIEQLLHPAHHATNFVGRGMHQVGDPFNYHYAATETQIYDDPAITLFFIEKDLKPGTNMTLHFTRTTTTGASFLPHVEANSIPFSSAELPEILTRFSIDPNSIEAESMKKTLQACEEPALAGESKYCATSLESMVEFCTMSLGTHNVRAVSTAVAKEGTPKQVYTVVPSGALRLAGSELVVCHAQTYAYAVFYCHTNRAAKAYQVSMVGEDGTEVKAVAVCHIDTAAWNPKHVAFQVLNVKPGTLPICHFLPQDHLVWSPNQ